MVRTPASSHHALRATVVGVALFACAGGACSDGDGRPRPTITEDKGVAALERAINGLNAARGGLLADTNAVVNAAGSLDAGDAMAAAGDREGMTRLRPEIEPRYSSATGASRRIAGRVSTYLSALTTLEAAATAPALDAGQRDAVTEVVRTGRAEHAVMTAFAQATARAWPRYVALNEAETLWYTRSRAGWYRNREESANAYAVMVSDDRAALDRARGELQRADTARVRAVAATSAAITAARTALVDLVELSG